MILLLRLIAVWLTSLLLFLAVPPGASAAEPPVSQSPAYTCDYHRHATAPARATTERGPPAVRHGDTTLPAVDDRGSHGTSPRPHRTPSWTYTTYDRAGRSAQPDSSRATTGTATQGRPTDARLSGLRVDSGPSVAANSVRPAVTDARLGRALADDFRGGPNPIGDGSALDAARHTVDTGELVGGSTHLEKAVEMRDRYARILRRGGLSSADQGVAQGRYDAYSSFVIESDLDAMMRARGLR